MPRLVDTIESGHQTRVDRPDPALQLMLILAIALLQFSSALWAMLSLVGRQELGLGATGYGPHLGCMRAGGIA